MTKKEAHLRIKKEKIIKVNKPVSKFSKFKSGQIVRNRKDKCFYIINKETKIKGIYEMFLYNPNTNRLFYPKIKIEEKESNLDFI